MASLFERFKQGLKKASPVSFFGKIGGLFSKKLDASSIEELEEALYGADFGVETTQEIIDTISEAFRTEKQLRSQEAAEIGTTVLARALEGAEGRLPDPVAGEKPQVIALIGVNGSGKTTTAAKLAYQMGRQGRSVVIGACDTFRAAANEQIRAWADKLGLDLVASQTGADAAAVAFDTYQAALSRGRDTVILDTAGRLHTKQNLMEELKKIRRVLQKNDPDAPQHRWLVVDGSLGSNSLEQARVFHEAFGLTGLVVTKLDGTSRGGALVWIYRELKLPVYFVGLGEKPDDLQPFGVRPYVNAIFGLESE